MLFGASKHKSDILIVAEDKTLTWQGYLEMQCQECFGGTDDTVTPAEWRRRCKRPGLDRMAEMKGMTWKTRNLSYKRAVDAIEEKHPGETRKAFRPRLFERCADLATTIHEGILRYNPARQAEVMSAISKWAAEWGQAGHRRGLHEVLSVTEA